MNRKVALYAPLVGRILVGGFFLLNGIEEFINLSATANLFAQAGLPYALSWAVAAAAVEVALGALLVVDYKTRIVALAGALYVLASSYVLGSLSNPVALQLFLENMAVIGGLLYICAYAKENRPR